MPRRLVHTELSASLFTITAMLLAVPAFAQKRTTPSLDRDCSTTSDSQSTNANVPCVSSEQEPATILVAAEESAVQEPRNDAVVGSSDPSRSTASVDGGGSGPVSGTTDSARSIDEPGASRIAAEPVQFKDRVSFWQIALGSRVDWLTSSSVDPFSQRDASPGLSLGATRTLMLIGNASLAAGLRLDVSVLQSWSRGADASMTLVRPAIPIEARYHLHQDFYVAVRAAPTIIVTTASILDSSAGDPLERTIWGFGLDVGLSASWVLFRPKSTNDAYGYGLWFDSGYGFVQHVGLELEADNSPNVLSLGTLELGGPFVAGGLAITF